MTLGGMIGTLVGTVLGGEAIRQVGNIGAMPSGLRSATQIGIGAGVLGHSLGNLGFGKHKK